MRDIEFIEDHRLGDANGARELLTSRMYRQFLDELRRLSPLHRWRVADLGASNGGFPSLMHLNGFVLERIVAVDMNPRILPRLRFNLEHNVPAFVRRGRKPEIDLYGVAIGAKRRTVAVRASAGTGGNIYAAEAAEVDSDFVHGFGRAVEP